MSSSLRGMKRAALAVPLLLLAGCVTAAPKPPPAADPPRLPALVVYELEGTAEGANITYATPTGTSQQQDVAVPLRDKTDAQGLRFTGFSPGAFLYISAQNTGEYGDLTCRIRIDSDVISENTASGAYAIATCQGNR